MIVALILGILALLILIGVLLGVFRESWLSTYLVIISFLVAIPIVILIKLISALSTLSLFLWGLITMTLKSVIKSLAIATIGLFLTTVIGISYFVPYIGKTIQKSSRRLKRSIYASRLVEECRYARQMMVEIVAEGNNRALEYDTKERYREELIREKENGKASLSAGESVLSLFFGGGLLIHQIYGFQGLQAGFYGFAATVAIEICLLVIAVSILYRVAILEFLAYTGTEEFSSITELDVALSYQRAVSQDGFIQLLTFMVVFAMTISNAERRTIRAVLGFYYDDGTTYLESMRFAWSQLRVKDSNQ